LPMDQSLHPILDHVTDVITCVSRTGRILAVNARVEHVFGYKPEEIVGKHFLRLGMIRFRDFPRLIRMFRDAVRKGRINEFMEIELLHKDGRSVFVEIGTRFIIADGKLQNFTNIIRDITDRKRMMDDLATAKRQAEAANRVKSDFLANMSHEIRTPMTAILGFADILAEGLTDPGSLDAVHTIKHHAEYLLGILSDILDLSKIEAGRLVIERRPCSPLQVIAEVVSLMRGRAKAKNIAINAESEGPLPRTIVSDPTRIRQILRNLVGNAIKFTEAGRVRLVTSLDRRPGKPPKLRFDVIDTGIGIREDEIVAIFHPFTQGRRRASGKPDGTGLGLAICRQLAKMLGGDIQVQSTPGKGSTFSVTIDVGDMEGLEMPAETAASGDCLETSNELPCPRLSDCRVLLADDGRDNVRLFSAMLRKSGAEVETVDNGQSAVSAVINAWEAGKEFDVVLMDMQMPIMDGFEATQRLRRLGYSGSIIALTACAMNGDRQHCLEAGCDDYLTKPIDRNALLACVASHIVRDCALASAAMEGDSVL
jgi:PAS domain S-box-containing protein